MRRKLKYGHNPHQAAHVTLYNASKDPLALANYRTPEGKRVSTELPDVSWGTLSDLNRGVGALVNIAAAFDTNLGQVPKIAVVLQHGIPSGAAFGADDLVIKHAIECNYRASFGAFIATNVEITDEVALGIRQWMPANRPLSGFAAPVIVERTRGFFSRATKGCPMFVNPALSNLSMSSMPSEPEEKSIRGAMLHQEPNAFVPKFPKAWDRDLVQDMCLAWGIAATSNSGAISIAKSGRLIANSAAEQERAAACEEAVLQAQRNGNGVDIEGAAVASDGYFSFSDGIDILGRKKVKAIFATHGSRSDKDIKKHVKNFKDLIFYTVPDATGRVFSGS